VSIVIGKTILDIDRFADINGFFIIEQLYQRAVVEIEFVIKLALHLPRWSYWDDMYFVNIEW
jgi:hypothetical protein